MMLGRVETAGRGEGKDSCGHCYEGWLMIERPNRHSPGSSLRAYACLCGLGLFKRKHALPADAVLSKEEVIELWPQGVPQNAGPITSRFQLAGVPPAMWTWTLETFKKRFGKNARARQYVQLAADWGKGPVTQRTDLVLYGTNGTGKTGLATSILLAALHRGELSRWTDRESLLGEWRECFRDGAPRTEAEMLKGLAGLPVMLIDEAAQGAASEWAETTLTRVIESRHRLGHPTILTLNLPEKDEAGEPYSEADHMAHLAQTFGPTLFDRLREKAQFWPMFGASKRAPLKLLPFKKPEEEPSDE